MGLRPKKRFGQHFLRDAGVVDRILRAFGPESADHVVEIGPGQGVLTRQLLGRVGRLEAIEIDRDLAAHLADEFAHADFKLHTGDALEFDFCALRTLDRKLRLIGNLPYNISTPLLFHLVEHRACVRDMTFMLQREVVDRLAATPGGKDYGRLSVMIQWHFRVEKLFNVPPSAFSPPPRVESSIVRLTPHDIPPVAVDDPARFAQVVKAAFAHRRKTLRNNLAGIVNEQALRDAGINPQRRAETLTLDEFATLARLGARAG